MVKMIKVSDDVHKKLNTKRIHPRETYEQIIIRAIKGELNPSEKRVMPQIKKKVENDNF